MAIRAKTKKRLFILLGGIVAVIALGTTIFFVRMNQIEAEREAMRAEGMAAYEQGNYYEAMHSLGTYLRHERSDAEVTYRYARARLENPVSSGEHLMEAANILRRVVELNPEHETVRAELLDLYEQLGFTTEALELSRSMLERNPNDAKAIRSQFNALTEMRFFDQALELAEECLEQNEQGEYVRPTAVVAEGYRGLAHTMGGQEQFEESLEASRQYNHLAPDDVTMQMLTLHLMEELNYPDARLHEHVQDVEFSEDVAGRTRQALLQAVAHRLTDQEAPAREALAGIPVEQLEDTELIDSVVGEMNNLRMYEESLNVLESAAEHLDDIAYRNTLSYRLIQNSRYDEAADYLSDVDPEAPNADSELLALRALSLYELNRDEEANRIAQELRSRTDDAMATRWASVLRQIFAEAPDPQSVVDAIDRAGDAGENNPLFQFWKGRAYRSLGEHDLAIASWERAARLSPYWPAPLLEMVQVHMNNGEAYEAFQIAIAANRRAPQHMGGTLMLIDVATDNLDRLALEEIGQLEAMLAQIHENSPNEPRTLPAYLRILLHQDRTDEAERLVEQALASDEAMPAAVLANMAEATAGHPSLEEPLLAALEQRRDELPLDVVFRRAMRAASQGFTDDGLEMFDAGIERAENATQRRQWRLARAQYLERIGSPEALPYWQELAEQYADSRAVQQTLLDTNSVWNDAELADQTINRVRALTGNSSLSWRVARARWLIENTENDRRHREARELLEYVTQQAPSRVEPRLLMAEYHERQNNLAAAISQLTRANQLAPERTDIQLTLARLYRQNEEDFNANRYLDQIAERTNLSPARLQQTASGLIQQDEIDRAAHLLEQHPEDQNLETQGLLAQVYEAQGRITEAADVYERLLEMQPNAQVVRAAAYFFANQNDSERAEQILALLDELEMAPAQRQMILSDYYRMTGEPETARRHLEEALDSQPGEANLWHRLIAFDLQRGQVQQALGTVEAARDELPDDASIDAMHRHRQAITDVADREVFLPILLDLLEEPARREVVGQVLSLWTNRGATSDSALQAASQIEQLAQENPGYLRLQMLSAGLYHELQQYGRAAEIAEANFDRFPNAPEPAWMATRAYARAEQWDRALEAGQEWRDRSGNTTVMADALLAQAYLEAGEVDQALSQIEPHLSSVIEAPEQEPQFVVTASRVLAAAGRVEEAGQLLEPMLTESAAWRGLWFEVGAERIPDAQMAAQWLVRVEPYVPDDATNERFVLGRSWMSLGYRTDERDFFHRSQAILQPLAEEEGTSAQIYETLALVHDLADEREQAKPYYRQALEVAPDRPVSLNNLAMILLEEQGDSTEALALAQRAVEQTPDAASFRDTLAVAHARLGDLESASEHFEQAIALQPNNPQWYLNWVETLVEHQDADQARVVLNRFEERFPETDELPEELQAQLEALREASPEESVSQLEP